MTEALNLFLVLPLWDKALSGLIVLGFSLAVVLGGFRLGTVGKIFGVKKDVEVKMVAIDNTGLGEVSKELERMAAALDRVHDVAERHLDVMLTLITSNRELRRTIEAKGNKE